MNQMLELMVRAGLGTKEELEKQLSGIQEQLPSEPELKPSIRNAVSQLKELRGKSQTSNMIKSHLGVEFIGMSREIIQAFARDDFKHLEEIETIIYSIQHHLSDVELRAMTEALFMESHRIIFDHGRDLRLVGCDVELPNIAKVKHQAIDHFALAIMGSIKENQITMAIAMMIGIHTPIEPASKALEVFESIKKAIRPYPQYAEIITNIAERRLFSEYSHKPEMIDYSNVLDEHFEMNLRPPSNGDFLEIVDLRESFDKSFENILDEHVQKILMPIKKRIDVIESMAQKKYLGESLQ